MKKNAALHVVMVVIGMMTCCIMSMTNVLTMKKLYLTGVKLDSF